MESCVACPVCGAEPGDACRNPVGRPVAEHKGRARREAARNTRPVFPAAAASTTAVLVTARFDPAATRRLVLEQELATARARYQQLQFVIEYLEGELS